MTSRTPADLLTRLQGPLLLALWGLAAGFVLWASGVDVAVQLWLYEGYHQGFNDAMRVLGDVGKGSTQAALCVILAVGIGLGNRWRGRPGLYAPRMLLAAIGVFVLAGGVNWVLKLGIGRARPKELLWNGGGAFDAAPFTLDALWWSFPSGHSCSTFAMAVWLGLAFPRWRRPLLGLAVVLSMSRFLAVTPHYLGDVVAGAAVGAAVAWALWMIWAPRLGATPAQGEAQA